MSDRPASVKPDLWFLYRNMFHSRLYEEAVTELWEEGLISGEMHLGTGEEGIVAGVLAHLQEGDALALDHRGTPPMLMWGADPVALLKEMLGREDGLCRGMGGHMHLFDRERLAASSGIVGASGPAACGFALAGRRLRPGSVAVAFFGEGAMNQGMLLESLNLAVVWQLPVLFVCKDNGWEITTRAEMVVGGDLAQRAAGFGLATASVDGGDVLAVWQAAREAVARARAGEGPTFLHCTCVHLEGHFLGDPLLRIARRPLAEMAEMAGPLTRAVVSRRGASLGERAAGLRKLTALIGQAFAEDRRQEGDPLPPARQRLHEEDAQRLEEVEADAARAVGAAVADAVGLQAEEEG